MRLARPSTAPCDISSAGMSSSNMSTSVPRLSTKERGILTISSFFCTEVLEPALSGITLFLCGEQIAACMVARRREPRDTRACVQTRCGSVESREGRIAGGQREREEREGERASLFVCMCGWMGGWVVKVVKRTCLDHAACTDAEAAQLGLHRYLYLGCYGPSFLGPLQKLHSCFCSCI